MARRWQDGFVRFDVSVTLNPVSRGTVTEYLRRDDCTRERVERLLVSMSEQAVARWLPAPVADGKGGA